MFQPIINDNEADLMVSQALPMQRFPQHTDCNTNYTFKELNVHKFNKWWWRTLWIVI